MKKIVSMILVVVCFMSVISFSGCAGKKLDTPKNVKCTDEGLITWTSVKNATSYDVTLNNEVYNVTTTSYQVSSTVNDFMYSIVAKAAGYKDSDPTLTYTFKGTGIVTPLPENLTVKINGSSEVRMGNMITLTAKVEGKDLEDTSVEWSIIEGE